MRSSCEPDTDRGALLVLLSVPFMSQSLTQLQSAFREDVRCGAFLPSNLKYLTCHTPAGARPNLAVLSRLTQLVVLNLEYSAELTQPLPQLPALLLLHLWTQDLQLVSSVATTLQELSLYAPHIDFRPPNSLTRFTRLHTLSLVAQTICGFTPEVLPPSLGFITIRYEGHHGQSADQLAFPAVGDIVKTGEHVVSWTRHSPDFLARHCRMSRHNLTVMLRTWLSNHFNHTSCCLMCTCKLSKSHS